MIFKSVFLFSFFISSSAFCGEMIQGNSIDLESPSVQFSEKRLQNSFDFVTLNDLNSVAAHVLDSPNQHDKDEFKTNVQAFLDTGVPDLEKFIQTLNSNDSYNQQFTGRKVLTGKIHPYLIHTFFEIIVPEIIRQQKIENSIRSNARLAEYQLQMMCAGSILRGTSCGMNELTNNQELERLSLLKLGKRVSIVYLLISSLDIRACHGDLTPLDFLAGVWFLQLSYYKFYPNDSIWIKKQILSDECSIKISNELGNHYLEQITEHALRTFK